MISVSKDSYLSDKAHINLGTSACIAFCIVDLISTGHYLMINFRSRDSDAYAHHLEAWFAVSANIKSRTRVLAYL